MDLSDFSKPVQEKAKRLLREKQDAVRQDEQVDTIWWVSSLRQEERPYRVQSNRAGDVEYLTCTCQHGLTHGGVARCYHASAVVLEHEGFEPSVPGNIKAPANQDWDDE